MSCSYKGNNYFQQNRNRNPESIPVGLKEYTSWSIRTYSVLGQQSFFSCDPCSEAFWQNLWLLLIPQAKVHRQNLDQPLAQNEKFLIQFVPRKAGFRITICTLSLQHSTYLLQGCMIYAVLQVQHSMHCQQYRWDVDLHQVQETKIFNFGRHAKRKNVVKLCQRAKSNARLFV